MIRMVVFIATFIGLFATAVIASDMIPVTGTVTYTTSRSVYVHIDRAHIFAAGDSVRAGIAPGIFSQIMVKAAGTGKIVLERAGLLGETTVAQTVYLDLPQPVSVPPAQQTPSVAGDKEAFGLPDIPVDGRLAIQYYRYRADNGTIEYDQPSVFLDLGTGANTSPLTLSLRLRSRVRRTLEMPDGRDMDDKRTDRLYDMAFTYRSSGYMVTVGRMRHIGDAGMGGMGGLDGIIGEYRDNNITGGIFAGNAPDLDNFIGDRSERKSGAYLVWAKAGELAYETAIAYINRNYHNGPQTGTLYIGQQLSRRGRFYLTGEAVVIVHRDNTGSTETPEDNTLQNARAYFSWTAAQWLRVSLNYSGYLVREYLDRNGLFDPLDIVRYGHTHTLQSRAELILPHTITLTGETLVGENHDGNTNILSAALRGRMSNILASGVHAGMSYVQTASGVGTGHHVLLNLSKTHIGITGSVSGGISTYERAHVDNNLSQRMQMSLYYQPGRRLYANMSVIRSWDEYYNANSLFLECGTRFGS